MPSAIDLLYLWFNSCVILTVKWSVLETSQIKKINFLEDILDKNGNIKTWENILQQHKINKQLNVKWLQLIHATPNLWKKEFVYDNGNCKNLLIKNKTAYKQ